ncbi:MAG: MMPL family transporter, partial [Actinobacteria bacterium]|nr:MMPL family transporter [Actinomycetota bacterium]
MASIDTLTPTPKKPNTGRRAVWIAVLVAIAWLAISGVVGPLAGKLNEVQKNDNASFLPASAESTLVADEQAAFSDNTSFPLLVIITRPDGAAMSAADAATAAAVAVAIPGLPVEGGGAVADYLDPAPIIPFPSQDGNAYLLNVPVNGEKGGSKLESGELAFGGITTAVRELALNYPDLQINATGPVGILADLIKVFGAIDTTLLGATALVVAIILIIVYRSPFLWLIPLLAAGIALSTASAIVYYLAKNDVLVLNGQSQGILTVLVFGA